MKYALTFVAGMLAVAFISASLAVAAERDREGPAPTGLVLKGVIKSVDLEAKTFVLVTEKDPQKAVERKFLTGAETAILIDGKTVTLADLKAGAKASVTFVKNGENEKLTATKVVVTTAAKPAERDRE